MSIDQKEKRRRLIRAEMVKRGITGKQIARLLKKSEGWISQVIAGDYRNAQVEEALMAAGVPGRFFSRQDAKEQGSRQDAKALRAAGGGGAT